MPDTLICVEIPDSQMSSSLSGVGEFTNQCSSQMETFSQIFVKNRQKSVIICDFSKF